MRSRVQVSRDCLFCEFTEASKDILCAPLKVCCPCCPWERILDPLYCIICAPCLCIARLKRKKKPEAAVKQDQGEAPPVNEIERMNRAMYETPADPNLAIAPVQQHNSPK